jgi:hypothetical protein
VFLSELSIKQPVLATMLAVSLVTLGIYSYRELSIDQYPDVEIPVLTVQTLYPGASPPTVEREVSKRIEEALNTIGGIRHISSTTTEGLSAIVAEFRLGTNIQTAQQDAQAKINAIRAEFPQDMEEPVIQRIDFNALPIVSVAVESPIADIQALSSLAEKVIQKRLENVPGVGRVNLVGPSRREIQILVDREKLAALGLTYAQVAGALRRENIDVPAGKLDQGAHEPLVRVAGKFRSVDEFRHLIVAMRNGRVVYLPEVARIVDGIEERRSASLVNDRDGISLDLVKQSGANTVEVADGVDRAVRELNAELPAHIRLRKVVDRSTFIRDVHDWTDSVNGPGNQECHPGSGLYQRAAPRRFRETRGGAGSGARAAPADPDDDAGHDIRHAAASIRVGRRRGISRPDGSRRHRWPDHLHAADAAGGAGGLYLPGRSDRPRQNLVGEKGSRRKSGSSSRFGSSEAERERAMNRVQSEARSHQSFQRPPWPLIIPTTLKGRNGPTAVDGLQVRSHQVPLTIVVSNRALDNAREWMKSYRPKELFDANGKLLPKLPELARPRATAVREPIRMRMVAGY